MKIEKPKVCINCTKRASCKTEDELREMQSNLLQHMRAISMYGGDSKLAMERLIENHKGELTCDEHEFDKNFTLL